MKRNFKLLVAVVVLAAMVMTLASCDVINGILDKINPPQPHEHTFSADWSYDATNHWHAATCTDSEECGSQKSDVAEHTYENGKCVCGADEPVCEHEYTISASKDANCTEDGYKTFTCTKCGHSYNQDVAALGHTEEKLPAKAPTCTESGLTEGKKCSECQTVITEQNTMNPTGHKYHDGKCLNCGEDDPDYIPPVTHVLDAGKLADKAKVDEEGFSHTESVGEDGFFTIYYALKTKVEGNEKTFDDGVTVTKRLNWQTSTVVSADLINAAIEFTVENAATVKVWWVSGGDGRAIAVYNADGTIVAQSAEGSVKNDKYITELAIPEAGTYYLGNVGGSNNYYQVSVSFFPAPKTYVNATTTDNYCWVDKVTFTAEGEGNYTFKMPAGLGAWEAESCDNFTGTPYVDYYSNENGDEFTVGLEAGATLEFYIASTEKKDWAIEWTYEACEVESGSSSDTPVVTSPLKIGTTEIAATNAAYEYVAPSAANLTLTAGGAIMGPVAITYSVNGGDATALELGASVTLALAAGDKVVVNITAEGYSSITAEWDGESAGGEDEVVDITGTYVGTDTWGNAPLTVVVGADGSVEFTYTHPMMGTTTFNATYEIVDGEVVLYNEDGSVINPLAGALTLTDGVLTGASYNGTSYTLAVGSSEGDDEEDDDDADANEAFVGFYAFDDYSVVIFDNGDVYLAEVFSDNYDLYFTFEAVNIGDDMYALMLEYYENTDYESGKDTYLATVLDFSIVITLGAEEEETDPNEAVVGFYEFDEYSVFIFYSDSEGVYLAEIYNDNYDLYFTFEAADIGDGMYALMLEYYARPDWEFGKDEHLNTVLDLSIVITPEVEDDEDTDPNEAVVGFYEFDEYTVFIFYSDSEGVYLAEIYNDNYDLFFTFEAVDIGDGMYALMLEYYARPDWEFGKDEHLNTVLDLSIVITPEVEDEDEEEVTGPDTSLDGTYTFNPEEGMVFTVKFEEGYIYVIEDTIGLQLSPVFAYEYNPMMGIIVSEEGYFYVDVMTGDLYYGRGWLLSPVIG